MSSSQPTVLLQSWPRDQIPSSMLFQYWARSRLGLLLPSVNLLQKWCILLSSDLRVSPHLPLLHRPFPYISLNSVILLLSQRSHMPSMLLYSETVFSLIKHDLRVSIYKNNNKVFVASCHISPIPTCIPTNSRPRLKFSVIPAAHTHGHWELLHLRFLLVSNTFCFADLINLSLSLIHLFAGYTHILILSSTLILLCLVILTTVLFVRLPDMYLYLFQ